MRPANFASVAALAMLGVQSLAAQAFQSLSTTDDGAILYFSSPDRIIGSSQSYHSKIFRWDPAKQFQLVADVRDPGASDGCTTANFYQLSAPQVSADGTILAYTASRPAPNGRYCTPSEPNQGVVQQNGTAKTSAGALSLSPNGRYAITTPTDAMTNEYHFVTDLVGGTSMLVSGAFNGNRRRITDEGAVLTTEPSALVLTDRTGGTRVWPTKMAVADAIVDRAGRTLVYLTPLGPNNPGAISTIDVLRGLETQIFSGFAPGNLNLTADGSHLVFTNISSSAGPQLFVMAIDGSGQRQIGTESVADIILSGDGRVIYGNSTDARLLRIDATSGVATELAPATPLLTNAFRPYPPATTIAAVGSVLTLYGSGLTSIQQVTFCGKPVSLLNGRVDFQVPWELPNQTCDAVVQTTSPFETALSLTVQQYDPQFVTDAFAHGDNWSIVTSTSPAHPGEIIVAFMTGLGPVDPDGQLSKPGFSCRFDSTPASLPYVGVAPGFPGIYQLNIQVPDLPESSAALTCGWDPLSSAGSSVWLGPN